MWDKLSHEEQTMLNLLFKSNSHPHMSTCNHLDDIHDLDAHPMTPAGTKVIIHEKRRSTGCAAFFYVSLRQAYPSKGQVYPTATL